ncbi:MAG TPA: hypothetical protein VHM20_06185 [Gammaproteobacteria bacterium]|jgi:hypothetical protein|nr:hypothetical protein [Gammaproteobacteria bacterium]
MTAWTQIKSTFFHHPGISAAIAWVTSTFVFLIPTCFELTPLGKDKRSAKKQLDHAQGEYDNTLRELNAVNEQINKSKQEVIDLDCAIAGYPAFNQEMEDFQQSINDSVLQPQDLLRSLWRVDFVPDRTSTEQSVQVKSYDEDEYVYEYYWSCVWHNCPDNESCCYDWGYHWVTETYDYNEITTIQNLYQGIINGIPLSLPTLDCGSYSRIFGTRPPSTSIRYESPHITSGRKEDGAVHIDFYREWGSQLPALYKLDITTTNFDAIVLRITDQAQAATDLAAKLNGFLATAIAAFNMAGANYVEIRDGIIENIPKLIDNANALNATLTEQGLVLDQQKTQYNEAAGEYKGGLSLWLPMFFLIPCGLGVLAYFIHRTYKDKYSSYVDIEEGFTADEQYSSTRRMEI